METLSRGLERRGRSVKRVTESIFERDRVGIVSQEVFSG
ncbi:hypothetical protein PMO31116_00625 [Pandoraea morbifera]|uniref:Uncharacterized protein n=1 Tax=Pandoraea morbifera TaxID=2508300 RepID=A0A5E4S6R9_9BURK|nr:hypothetical protein PMO31116_00625 [Pandoraea morbifera]